MPKIQWTKDDVIKKFREAMTSPAPLAGIGQRPSGEGTLRQLLQKASTKKGTRETV